MSNQIEEEQKTQLLRDDPSQLMSDVRGGDDPMEFNNEAMDDMGEIRPSSSKVKKVLIWNSKRQEFDMSEDDKRELRDAHIKDLELWREFEELYRSLDP